VAVTVLLVDDAPELRAVVRTALKVQGDFDVVGEAGDGAGAIEAAGLLQPDVVVLDLGLPDLAGSDVLAGVRRAAPDAKVVVFTGSVSQERVDLLRQVEGFVRKDQEIRYLVSLLSDLSREQSQLARVDLGPSRNDVAAARRFVTEQCERWHCGAIVEDAQLVVTELVTNALVHAGSTCELSARLAGGVLRLEVADTGRGVPDPQLPEPFEERGRGLLLVSALSTAWGTEGADGGRKVVWAELPAVVDSGRPGLSMVAPGK